MKQICILNGRKLFVLVCRVDFGVCSITTGKSLNRVSTGPDPGLIKPFETYVSYDIINGFVGLVSKSVWSKHWSL